MWEDLCVFVKRRGACVYCYIAYRKLFLRFQWICYHKLVNIGLKTGSTLSFFLPGIDKLSTCETTRGLCNRLTLSPQKKKNSGFVPKVEWRRKDPVVRAAELRF